jgi:hypothetical protein
MWYFRYAVNKDRVREGVRQTGLRCAFEVCTRRQSRVVPPREDLQRKDACTINVHVQRLAFAGHEMTILRCLFLGLVALVSSLFRASIIISLAVALLLARERVSVIDCFMLPVILALISHSRVEARSFASSISLAYDSTSLAQVSNVSGRWCNRICTCPCSGRARTP